MSLASNLVDPVVRIGSDTEPVATGFFYSFYIPEESAVWLVTCKHVIEEYQSLKMIHLPVYMNTVGGGVSTCSVPLYADTGPLWTLHQSLDVAVVMVPVEFLKRAQMRWASYRFGPDTFTASEMSKVGLGLTDRVHLLGFPIGWKEASQDQPIARGGMIAQILPLFDRKQNTYLVDAAVFPGNSGGPVLTERNYGESSRLIGMVSATTVSPLDEIADDGEVRSAQTSRLLQNADLGLIVPLESINETILDSVANNLKTES